MARHEAAPGTGRGSTAEEIAVYTHRPVGTKDSPLDVRGTVIYEDIPAQRRERFWGATPATLVRSITGDFLSRLADSVPSEPLEHFAGLTAQIVAAQPDIDPAALHDRIRELTAAPDTDGATYTFGENRLVDAAVGTAYDHSSVFFSEADHQESAAPEQA